MYTPAETGHHGRRGRDKGGCDAAGHGYARDERETRRGEHIRRRRAMMDAMMSDFDKGGSFGAFFTRRGAGTFYDGFDPVDGRGPGRRGRRGGPDGGGPGDGRPDKGGPNGGGRGGGRRRMFNNEGLRLLFLHLISQEPRHGYEIIREVENLSGGAYTPSPGMVYPALSLLAEMEHITEQPGEGARRRFAITPTGEAFLAEHQKEREAVLARLQQLSQSSSISQEEDNAPLFRAMDNLKAVLRIRLGRAEKDADTILDIAALIDEAAAKIERLK